MFSPDLLASSTISDYKPQLNWGGWQCREKQSRKEKQRSRNTSGSNVGRIRSAGVTAGQQQTEYSLNQLFF
jgi:hypothetical protein